MKILVLCNKVPYPPKDGGAIATLGLIRGLAKLGCEVTVLAMNTRKHHITPFEMPTELTSQIVFHMVEVPAPISLLGLIKNFFFSELPYNAERFISSNYSNSLEKLLDHQQFDLIQLEGLYVTPYIPIIRKKTSAKIAYRSHNIEHEIWYRRIVQSFGIKKLYLKNMTDRLMKFERKAMNEYDFLVPITDRDALILDDLGNKKPRITIPAGIDILKNEEPCEVEQKNNFFFIGALDWAPNQEGLLWFLNFCWPLILAKKPDAELCIAGRNAPEIFVAKLKEKNVVYFGEVPDAQKFMKENGTMIVPLLSGSGMRVKVIEAMNCGKAIVSTSIGCEGIPVENNKHLCVADNPLDFVFQAVGLINDKEKRNKMAKLAHTFVSSNYDNDRIAKKLFDFYNRMIV